MLDLHGKYVETTVYHSHGSGDEGGSFGDEVVYGAAEFLGFAETLEGCLAYDVGSSFGQ